MQLPQVYKEKPQILAHPADTGGCGWYRVVVPAQTLSVYEGMRVQIGGLQSLDPIQMKMTGGSVAVVQRQTETVQIDVVKAYHNLGVKVVHDLDDLLWNAPVYNAYRPMFKKERKQTLDWILRNADVLTTSTVPLSDAIFDRHKRRAAVIPNVLATSLFQRPKPRVSGKLRVGWAGSNTHSHDLERLRTVIIQTHKEISWVFLGYAPKELLPYVEIHPPVDVRRYVQALSLLNLDVAVAPLDDNHFNQCKSNLKLVEFGAIGLPVVTSDVYPYKDNPGFKIKNSRKEWKEWIDVLMEYSRNEPLRFLHASLTSEYAYGFNSGNTEYRNLIKRVWWSDNTSE